MARQDLQKQDIIKKGEEQNTAQEKDVFGKSIFKKKEDALDRAPFQLDFDGKKIIIIPTQVGQRIDFDLNDGVGAGGAIIMRHITFASGDATPTVANVNLCDTAGTTTITDFDNGVVGQIITIRALASITITNDASIIVLNGAADYAMTVTDTLTLAMFTDQVWHEIARSVN